MQLIFILPESFNGAGAWLIPIGIRSLGQALKFMHFPLHNAKSWLTLNTNSTEHEDKIKVKIRVFTDVGEELVCSKVLPPSEPVQAIDILEMFPELKYSNGSIGIVQLECSQHNISGTVITWTERSPGAIACDHLTGG